MRVVVAGDETGIGAQTMSQNVGQGSLIQSTGTVTNVDFRRGPNGEGRVLVTFNKDNVGTDLRKEGNKIIVDIFDVATADALPRRLDVTDFATPVNMIETNERSGGVRMEILTNAVKQHGLDRKAIRDYVANTTHKTILGDIRFQGSENVGTPGTVGQWQNGEFEVV